MSTKEAKMEVFWLAYQGLSQKERRTLAGRILLDRTVTEDWLDHLLIERSRRERGKDIPLEDYLSKRTQG